MDLVLKEIKNKPLIWSARCNWNVGNYEGYLYDSVSGEIFLLSNKSELVQYVGCILLDKATQETLF